MIFNLLFDRENNGIRIVFEKNKKKHFTGAAENIFLRKVDAYLNLP